MGHSVIGDESFVEGDRMRTIDDLRQLQALPLSLKVALTKDRVRQWVHEYGTDGVYVSFSGGKDSTVLLDIVRSLYPDIPAVFSDTGLEYPEIREFVRTFDNVEWLKPKMSFKQVIEKYGYPFISKEISESVYHAKKYLTRVEETATRLDRQTDSLIPYAYSIADFFGIEHRKAPSNPDYLNLKRGIIPEQFKYGKPYRLLQLEGKAPYKKNGVLMTEYSKRYDKSRWRFLLYAPFSISNLCCSVMKKGPMNAYARKTGRHPMTAQMAVESFLRQSAWVKNGCNAFNTKKPISNPMSFWTEQDVLLYIKNNRIPICSVYGEIVEVGEINGQMTISDYEGVGEFVPELTTTGCKRTGCMFCGFGCHLEKAGEGRFELMKKTHPKQYEWIMKDWDAGGLGYKRVIDWLNENGNLNIRY